MASLSLSKIRSGAALLKKLLDRIDNGDATLTATEVMRADNSWGGPWGKRNPVEQWTVDLATHEALLAAVNRRKRLGDRSIAGMKEGIDEALAEAAGADADDTGALSDAEQKKVKSTLARTLLAFSRRHAGKKASSFTLRAGTGPTYVPKTPFHAPPGAAAAALVEALATHFNSYANDNSTGGPRPGSITRYVLGPVEVRGVAAAIGALPAARAKAALRELSRRIHQRDLREKGFQPRRIWVEPRAEPPLDRLAARLGVKADFHGNPAAPKFDYY